MLPLALCAVWALVFWAAPQAHAENRSLHLYYTHTKETIQITYKRNGKFDEAALKKLNRFLRDWRQDKSVRMDPALFDILWEVYRQTKATGPIHIVSAYRSPTTNEALRSRSRRVAKSSQHMRGKAIDFFIPSVDMRKVRIVGLKLQQGGVGWYPSSASKFVHLDTGSVRHWPRMTRQQLARVFPDGKTVHVPTDGKPMPRYADAARELARSGRSPSAVSVQFAEANGISVPRPRASTNGQQASSYDPNNPAATLQRNGDGKGLLALLFGDQEDETEERSAAEPQSAPVTTTTTTAVSIPAAPVPPSSTDAPSAPSAEPPSGFLIAEVPMPDRNPFIERQAPEPVVAIAEAPAPLRKPQSLFAGTPTTSLAAIDPPVDLSQTGQDGAATDAFDKDTLVAYAREQSPQDRIEALLREEAGISMMSNRGGIGLSSLEQASNPNEGYEWLQNRSSLRPNLVGHQADWHFISPSKHEKIDRRSVFAEAPLHFRLMRMDSPLSEAPQWVMMHGFDADNSMLDVGRFSGTAVQALRLKGPFVTEPTTTASIPATRMTR